MNFLFLAVGVLAVFLAVKYFLEKISSDDGLGGADVSSYVKKARLMNDSEIAFFVNLRQVLGEAYLIFPKVRIEDFVEVKKGIESRTAYGLRGRIKSRHIDFLVCDRVTTAPILAIEVDGKSHERSDRRERDDFVEKLYESVGLPLHRVKVGNDFRSEAGEISRRLESLKTVANPPIE